MENMRATWFLISVKNDTSEKIGVHFDENRATMHYNRLYRTLTMEDDEMTYTQDYTPYVYVLVRRDLSPEQITVQSCHAAIEAASLIPPDLEHPHLVVCGVNNETQLEQAAARLEKAEILFREFREADIGDQLTAIATQPIFGEDRRHFKKYKCLKLRNNTPIAALTPEEEALA